MNQDLNSRYIILLLIGIFLSIFMFFFPFFRNEMSDPFSYLFLMLFLGITVYILTCFSEYESTFVDRGGVYSYLKSSYNKFVGFLGAVIVVIGANYIVAFLALTCLTFNPIFSILLVLGIYILFNLIVAFRPKIFKVTMYILLLGVIGVFVFIAFKNIFFGPSMIELDLSSTASFETLLFYLFFILSFVILLYSFVSSSIRAAIENIPDINKFFSRSLVFIVPILVIILSRIIPMDITLSEVVDFIDLRIALIFLATLMFFLAFSVSTIILTFSQEGLLPQFLQIKKNRRYRIILNIGIFLVTLIAVDVKSFNTLKGFILGYTLILSLLTLGIFLLRIRRPDLERPYAVKFWQNPSILISAFLFFIITIFVIQDGIRPLLLIGTITFFSSIYFFLFERYYNEKMQEATVTFFAPLDISRWLPFSRRVQDYIIKNLGDIDGKTIFEFGCKTGNLTLLLMDQVGRKGRVFATDKSEKALSILKKKLKAHGHSGSNYSALHDFPSAIHPAVPIVDKIVSVGTIDSVHRIDHVLKEMNLQLKLEGQIIVVGYDKILQFFPYKWLSDDKNIYNMFLRNGFLVKVERKRGLFCETVFISGTKYANAYNLDSWYSKDGTTQDT